MAKEKGPGPARAKFNQKCVVTVLRKYRMETNL